MATDRGTDGKMYAEVESVAFTDIPDDSLIICFLQYWRSIANSALLPARANLDPIDIPKIIPWMFLVDVLREGGDMDFRFRLIGTRNADLVGHDATGELVADAFPEATASLMSSTYADVVEQGQPRCWRASLPETDRAFIECYRALFPFATDGRKVDMIAGLLMPTDRRHL